MTVYIDGVVSDTLHTGKAFGYRITPPEKPEDIATNPNSEKYFYGWFVDSNYQTPLLDETEFRTNGAIYGKWVTVYSSNFKYTVSEGKATITSIKPSTRPTLVIPAYINGFPVVAIGESAFSGNTFIRTLILCNGIQTIGSSAFSGCNSITHLELPKSLVTIGNSAFENCSTLTEVLIPENVTSIGSFAFSGCSELTSITIPNSVTTIGNYAFSGCSRLTSITLPFVGGSRKTSSDTYQYPFGYIFGRSKYGGSIAIHQYYYGNSTSSTTSDTYYLPASLKSVTITGGKILYGAFYNCESLTSITIGNGVTAIDTYAFRGCTGLKSIQVASGNRTYHSDGDCLIETATKTLVLGWKNSIIPSDGSVTTIGNHAFQGCSGLANITIPNSVTSIGSYAFSGCTNLTRITIPNSVTSIGSDAFSGCSGLTSITIPSSVTEIGDSAFWGCRGLTSITLPFVGGSRKTSSNSYQYPFGYIFGTSKYSGSIATEQNYYGYSSATSDTYYLPASLKSVTITGGEILYGAFYNCTGLTSITISDSVTTICENAFRGCTGLTSVTWNAENCTSAGSSYSPIFNGCTKLAAVTFGEKVKNIPSCAFFECTGLTSIKIPNSVTSIDNSAFRYCTGLTSITIGNSVTAIGDSAFSGCTGLTSIKIPNSVTTIGNYAFSGCMELSNIYITDITAWCKISGLYWLMNYDSSNKNLYLNNKLVTELVIPEGVTKIGDYAFSYCSGLASITIPNSVTSIGNSAFSYCSGLASITIPNSVTTIGDYAFRDCMGLTNIYITDLTAWCKISGLGNLMFYGSSNKNLYLNNELVTELVIPDGVTSIDNSAFSGCTELTSITIPSSVTSIGNSAFSGCTELTSITIPSGVTSIGNSAFYGCSGLTSIEIPNSVTSIGYYAFWNCTGLTSITIPDSVTTIGDCAFRGCSGLANIYYTGTVDEWNAISKGSSWNYNTGSYTIHYNYKPEE